jgi:Domain of unknown function (DUF4349)
MRRRMMLGTVAFVALAGLVGAACGGGGSGSPAASAAGSFVPEGMPSPASDGRDSSSGSGSSTSGKVAVPSEGLAPRVVKTAAVEIRLKDGTFDQRFQEATQAAARFGGFVSSSQSAEGKHRSGTLVMRIPVDQFESALGALKALGRVTSERVGGQDVTAQFVDLEARLRNWQAQESVLLTLMAKATTIDDSIRVQRELQDVQLQIEQLRGQLRVLNDQADFSTITLSMAEAGFVVPPDARKRSTLSQAWHDAAAGFLAVVAAVVVGLGYLIPLGLLLLIAWVVFRKAQHKVVRPV